MQRIFLAKYHFQLFLITMVTISGFFLAHVLSWVKTNHLAKFQRNPLTCLVRMVVQTDRHIHIYIYIYIYTQEIYDMHMEIMCIYFFRFFFVGILILRILLQYYFNKKEKGRRKFNVNDAYHYNCNRIQHTLSTTQSLNASYHHPRNHHCPLALGEEISK